VRLASRGLRDMDHGRERIESPEELAAVQAQARKVLFRSVLATGTILIGMLLLA
jgi:hypothetical protein